jgi:hypothetical protein
MRITRRRDCRCGPRRSRVEECLLRQLPAPRWIFVAALALKLTSNVTRTSFRSGHPQAIRPRRVVTNVLCVAALQVGHPVVLLILVKSDDLL